MVQQPEKLPALAPEAANIVQQEVDTFLYYAHAVKPTMMLTFNIIISEQANSTQATSKKMVYLLNYAAIHPEAITQFFSSVMVLHMHSEASFLSATISKSREVGYH